VKKLIVALEEAENKGRINVTFSKPVNDISKDQVKLLFGEKAE